MKYSVKSCDGDPNSINQYPRLHHIHVPTFTATEPDHKAGSRNNPVIYIRFTHRIRKHWDAPLRSSDDDISAQSITLHSPPWWLCSVKPGNFPKTDNKWAPSVNASLSFLTIGHIRTKYLTRRS